MENTIGVYKKIITDIRLDVVSKIKEFVMKYGKDNIISITKLNDYNGTYCPASINFDCDTYTLDYIEVTKNVLDFGYSSDNENIILHYFSTGLETFILCEIYEFLLEHEKEIVEMYKED